MAGLFAPRQLDPVRVRSAPQRSPSAQVFGKASSDPSRPLDPHVRERLAGRHPHDFAKVRVHTGEASRAAAESIGARAYTLGRDIHLGAEAEGLSRPDRTTLLMHEATHSAQQGMRHVRPSPGLPIGSPADHAEREADRMAAVTPAAPRIQRDLTGKKAVKDGTFDLNLKTESHPGDKSGMSGTIEFMPGKDAPDSTLIKLLQTARLEDLGTGKDYPWTGGEAPRSKMQTTAAKGIDPGYFVDHFAASATPRSKKADAPVSPYYRTYVPYPAKTHDGRKKDKTIKSASMWDYPGWAQKGRFSFETAAKGVDTGYHYATLTWGFTVSDPAKGKIDNEHADAHRAPSATFHAAVAEFNKYYKNPGSPAAP